MIEERILMHPRIKYFSHPCGVQVCCVFALCVQESSAITLPVCIRVYACGCLLFTRADRDNREANFNKSKQFPPSASRFPILAGRAHKTKQSKKSAVHFPLTICLWIPILWDIAPPFLFESTKPDAGYHLPHSSLNWLHVWKSHKASLTYGQCSIFTTMQCICSYPTRF